MYKVKRGTIKANGKDYLPGEPLPEMGQEDIENLLAEKLIEAIPEETDVLNALTNLGTEITKDILEDPQGLKTEDDSKVDPEQDESEEEVDTVEDFNVNFDLDNYVSEVSEAEDDSKVDPEPETEHKTEHEHKKAAHKKGGK